MDLTPTPLSKARLAHLSKLKSLHRGPEVLLEGPHLVEEAARTGTLREVLVPSAEAAEEWGRRWAGIPCTLCRAQDFERIALVRTPQAVLGLGVAPRPVPLAELLAGHPRILYLDAVQDPGNVGTILRTGLAVAGTGFIFGPGTAERFSPKVLRASGGAVLQAPACGVADHAELLAALTAAPHRRVILDPHEGLDFRSCPPPSHYLLVAGNEGAGASLPDPDRTALRLRIPLDPRIESLNVAVSVAMVLARWA